MSRLIIVTLLLAATSPQIFAQSGRVTGRIVDATTGEPAVGVRVTLTMAPVVSAGRATQPPQPLPLRPLSTETNANGAFDITGVPAGRWRVQTQKTGYVPYGPNSAPIEVSGGTVSVPEIRLDRGGVIAGRLLDVKGNPLSGMTVRSMLLVRSADGTVRPGGGGASVQTNDLGEFRLSGLPPGQHHVLAQPRIMPVPLGATAPPPAAVTYVPTFYPGFANAAEASPINVASGATTNGIDFSLLSVPAFQVSGIVVDADGRAVAGAVVQLAQPQSMTMSLLQGGPSGTDGTFRITNVPSGTYRAMAAIPVIVRNGNSTSTSLSFGAAASRAAVEIVVQGANLGGVRVVVVQP